MGISTAGYIAISAALATTAYTVASSEQAKGKANDAANAQAQKQDDLMKQQQQQMADQESSAQSAAARDQARKKQLAATSTGAGANNTILTSPLGATNQNTSGGGKTLLGT